MVTPGRVVFAGAVHESAPALQAILDSRHAELAGLVTFPEETADKLAGAVDLVSMVPDGLPLIRTMDVNAPETVQLIRELKPDLLVVVGWTRLIRDELLALPTHGCVGFHASLLPLHRGRAPVNWSLILGEHETGNTMMVLAPGADLGDIVDQRRTPIYLDDTCATVYDRVGRLGADMLTVHLPALLTGTADTTEQDESEGDLMPKRTPAMGIIDWDRPPVEVHNWVRGQTSPYPGAFTHLDGRKVMVWATVPPMNNSYSGPPGTVLAIEAGGLRVAVRGGSVVLARVSWAGGRPMPAAEWAASNCEIGDRLEQPDLATASWARGLGPRPKEGTDS
jgi:methionyl-tRNA formyltransferase